MSTEERRIFWIVALIGLVFCLWSGYSIAGSGQKSERETACHDKTFDQYVIADAILNHGMTQEALVHAAKNSPKLPDERRARAEELVNEAFEAKDVREWFNSHWLKCMGGEVKSEQFTRKDKCERWAAFAVELRKDKDAGVIVNVSPNLEKFKQMVWAFEGTPEELRESVMADCLFVRT